MVLEASGYAGKGLYVVRRMRLMDELASMGVQVVKNAAAIAVRDCEVTYSLGEDSKRVTCDHVIVAQGATRNTDLAEALLDAGIRTHTIGDCRGVSYIEGAMESAAKLAVSIG